MRPPLPHRFLAPRLLPLALLVGACTVQTTPTAGGSGLATDQATGAVSLDPTRVPIIESCADGQVVRRRGDKWVCEELASVPLAESAARAADADKLGGKAPDAFAPATHQHAWSQITGAPTMLGDLACQNGEVARFIDGAWDCQPYVTETEADAWVANNGYAEASALAPVATGGRFADLAGVPAGLADGDNDALGALTCLDGQVPKRSGAGWVCATLSSVDLAPYAQKSELAAVATGGRFADLTSVPAGLADGDNDVLGGLSCSDNQIAKRAGGAWTCAPLPTVDTTAFLQNQSASSQAASFRISGTGAVEGGLAVGTATAEGALTVKGDAAIRGTGFVYRNVGELVGNDTDPWPTPRCPCDLNENAADCASTFTSATDLTGTCYDFTMDDGWGFIVNVHERQTAPVLTVKNTGVGIFTATPDPTKALHVKGDLQVDGRTNLVPPGTLCGLCIPGGTLVSACNGVNVCSSAICPAGFTYKAASGFITCVKY